MTQRVERVRAAHAGWDHWAGSGFGFLSWGLGLAELLMPYRILDWLGVHPRMAPLVRLFGLREIGTGAGLLPHPAQSQFLWARVAGDALDLGVLGLALTGYSRRPDRVMAALGIIGAITALDVLMSVEMTKKANSACD